MRATIGRLEWPAMARRGRWADVIFAVACVASFVVLLRIGADLTFFGDEWDYIRSRDPLTVDWLLARQNEHLWFLPKVVYGLLLTTVGIGLYAPYLVVLLLLHVVTASAVYVYARRQTEPLLALAVGTVLLFLGAGAEDLMWAFQLGIVGSCAAGAWALTLLLQEPRPERGWPTALLLCLSILCSSVGLAFLASVATVTIVVRRLRRRLWVVVPAATIYTGWFLLYGPDYGARVANLRNIGTFAEAGLANAMGQVTGLGAEVGVILVVLLVGAGAWDIVSGRVLRGGLIAGSAGLLAHFVLLAISRADGDVAAALAPAYVYPAAVFIFVALIGWVGDRRLAEDRHRVGMALAVVVIATLALAWNGIRLGELREVFAGRAQQTLAGIAVLREFGGSTAIPADRGLQAAGESMRAIEPDEGGSVIPGSTRLHAIEERYGLPNRSTLAIADAELDPAVLDRVLAELVADALELTPAAFAESELTSVVETVTGATVSVQGSCLLLSPHGPDVVLEVSGPSGTPLFLTPAGTTTVRAVASRHGTYDAVARELGEVGAGSTAVVRIPDIGEGRSLRLRVGLAGGGDIQVCDVAPPATPEAYDVGDVVIRRASQQSVIAGSPEVEFSYDVRPEMLADGCVAYMAVGDDPHVSFRVPDGHALRVVPASGGPAQVFLRLEQDYSEEQSRHVTLDAAPYEVFMPSGSQPGGWAIRVDPPDAQGTVMCLVPIDP